jgi:predicted PurR-regulated permease PerM
MSKLKEYPFYLKATIILAGFIMLIYSMIAASGVMVPLFLSGFLAMMLIPPCNELETRGMPRTVAAMISILLVLLIILAIGFLFITQIRNLMGEMPDIQARVQELTVSIHDAMIRYSPGFMRSRVESMDMRFGGSEDMEFSLLSMQLLSTFGGLTFYLAIPIFVFLFLIYRDFLNAFMVKAFSGGNKERLRILIDKIKNVVQSYISGMFIVICILAVLNTILLLSLGVQHAVLFGVFAAMLNVIPFLGPIFGSIVPAVYALLTMESLWIPVLVILGFYIIQLFESNLFTPVIVGDKVSLNPLVTIIAILVGGKIWGLLGMILFIPALAIMKLIFDEVESLQNFGFLLGKVDKNFKKPHWKRPGWFNENLVPKEQATDMDGEIRLAREEHEGNAGKAEAGNGKPGEGTVTDRNRDGAKVNEDGETETGVSEEQDLTDLPDKK